MKIITKKMTGKIGITYEDEECLKCGYIYQVYYAYEAIPLECEKCKHIVWYDNREHPDKMDLLTDKEIEEKYGKEGIEGLKVTYEIFEKNIPPCPKCNAKLKAYIRGNEGSPLHCPKCGSTERKDYPYTDLKAPVKGLYSIQPEVDWLTHIHSDDEWAQQKGIKL